MDTTLTLIDLAGSIALLLWGVHMVQSGIQRAFGPQLRRFLGRASRRQRARFETLRHPSSLRRGFADCGNRAASRTHAGDAQHPALYTGWRRIG